MGKQLTEEQELEQLLESYRRSLKDTGGYSLVPIILAFLVFVIMMVPFCIDWSGINSGTNANVPRPFGR